METKKGVSQQSVAGGRDHQNGDWKLDKNQKGNNGERSYGNHHVHQANNGNISRNSNLKTSILERMSISFFITNFPHNVTYKDLWKRCADWGSVVDIFIAHRLSKAGKRFAFVRFIKVSDAESLRSNLNSMWFAKFKIFADVVRFNRSFRSRQPVPFNGNSDNTNQGPLKPNPIMKSYAEAVSESNVKNYVPMKRRIVNVTCAAETDTSLSTLLKVIGPTFIPSVRQWLHSEGFFDVCVKYIGGRWILVTFSSAEAEDQFLANDSLKGRFSACKTPINSFVPDERMVWVEVHGIPKGAWHNQAMKDITNPWGKGIFFCCEWISDYSVAKVCLLSDSKSFIYEELTISLEDKPYTVWIKEFSPWEPKILSPLYASTDFEAETESCDDNTGKSDGPTEDNDYTDDSSQHSAEFDPNLCKDNSFIFVSSSDPHPVENLSGYIENVKNCVKPTVHNVSESVHNLQTNKQEFLH